MKRQIVAIFFALIACQVAAYGQTTRPAQASWDQTVAQFATALPAANVEMLRSTLTETASVRSFRADAQHGLFNLVSQTELTQIVGVHSYPSLAASIASDLAEDFDRCADIPRDSKSFLIPSDESQFRKANQTAQQWVSALLDAGDQQWIGIIALWQAPDRVSGNRSPAARLIIVLLKGQEVEPGVVRIQHVLFGNPINH